MLGEVASDRPQASANAELANNLQQDECRREEQQVADGRMDGGESEGLPGPKERDDRQGEDDQPGDTLQRDGKEGHRSILTDGVPGLPWIHGPLLDDAGEHRAVP